MHSFEKIKGVVWLMKVDRNEDHLNTQFTDMICRQVPCSKVTTNYGHLFAKWFPSHLPHHGWWVPLLSFTSSKRVTNTRYSLSEDKSRLICFTNLREERFLHKTGLSMFNLTSLMKENLVSFMFIEFERPHKKTPKGSFFIWFSP